MAVLKLKQQRDKLKQYQTRIEAVMERELAVIKQLLREGKRDKAKLVLRKKKYQEILIEKTYAQLENIGQMVDAVELKQQQQTMVESLEAGNAALKAIEREMSIEDVERVMSDTADGIAYVEEVTELLGQNMGSEEEEARVAADWEALMAETEAVEAAVAAAGTGVGGGEGGLENEPVLPDAPTDDVKLPSAETKVKTTAAAAAAAAKPQLVPA